MNPPDEGGVHPPLGCAWAGRQAFHLSSEHATPRTPRKDHISPITASLRRSTPQVAPGPLRHRPASIATMCTHTHTHCMRSRTHTGRARQRRPAKTHQPPASAQSVHTSAAIHRMRQIRQPATCDWRPSAAPFKPRLVRVEREQAPARPGTSHGPPRRAARRARRIRRTAARQGRCAQ